MSALLIGQATAERCGGEVYDGSVPRRCSRPASAVRDGLLVCGQHARLEAVRWAAERPEAVVVGPVSVPDRRWWQSDS